MVGEGVAMVFMLQEPEDVLEGRRVAVVGAAPSYQRRRHGSSGGTGSSAGDTAAGQPSSASPAR